MPQEIKIQSPIQYKGNYIFPLTTYDQIIMSDGSRWDGSSGAGGSAASTLTATHDGDGNVTLSMD